MRELLLYHASNAGTDPTIDARQLEDAALMEKEKKKNATLGGQRTLYYSVLLGRLSSVCVKQILFFSSCTSF